MLLSVIAAGVMLRLSPVGNSNQVLVSVGVVLLAPLVLWLGWITGVSNFAASSETYRRATCTAPLIYLLPILLTAIVALGFLGGSYWWLLSFAIAIQGFRKGIQRAWWLAITYLGFGLRSLNDTHGDGLFATDEDALATAIKTICQEIRSEPNIP
jgi:hypothetical protein